MALGTRDTAGSPTRRTWRAALRALAVPVLLAPLLALAGPGAGASNHDPEPTWTLRLPDTSPQGRSSHAMAYDAARGEVMLFGGQMGFTMLDDTWVWDGAEWTEKSPPTSPEPDRKDHAMAYDAARGEVVLFGGCCDGLSLFGDTWVWDGTDWTQKTPATSPPARAGHAMAYDVAREEVVLFGGSSGGDETWVWDGADWAQRSPTSSPSARSNHAMAYDAARGEVVLFGGWVYSDETWIWDGNNWTQKSPTTKPPSRAWHAMAYDGARGEVVLFGGSPAFGDTWVWGSDSILPPVTTTSVPLPTTTTTSIVPPTTTSVPLPTTTTTTIPLPTEYASDACDGMVGSSTVADGFVGDAYLKVRTAPGDDPSESLVCLATEAGGLHLGGAITASAGATPSVDTDFTACDAAADEADLHHERVPAVLGQELFHLDVNLMGDEVWVCLRLAADPSTDRRVVVPVDPGSPPDLEPALDPLSPRVPAYTAAPPADPGLPSSACQGASEGTTTRVVNAEASGTHAWLYAWQESATRSHLCVRGEGADDTGGRLTVDGNGSQTVVTTSTDVAPCDFNIVTDHGGPGPVPGYTIKTSDPESGAPASVCLTTTTGVAQRVTVDAGDQSVVTWTSDA